MTLLRSMSRTATAVVASCALLLTATACGGDDDSGGFRPHPPKPSGAAGPGGKHDDSPTSETPAPATGPDAAEQDAPVPTFLYPNGREVTLTAPGTRLGFGEPATLATTDQEGRYLVWSVAVHDGVVRAPADVPLVDPAEGAGVDHYLCYAYDITFLGAVPRYTDDPTVLTGVPDVTRTPVAAPRIRPATVDGADARRVAGGTDQGCGIPEGNRLPPVEGDLAVGHPFARGALGAVGPDAAAEGTATGVRYDVGGDGANPVIWS